MEKQPDQASSISFRRVFIWVLIVHLALLLALSLWNSLKPAPPPPIKFVNMVNAGDLVKGEPGASVGHKTSAHPTIPKSEAPPPLQPSKQANVLKKPSTIPPPPIVTQKNPEPEEQEVTKTPAKPIPPQLKSVEPSLVSKLAPSHSHKPAETKPARPKVKVDLEEVTRNESNDSQETHRVAYHPPARITSNDDEADPGLTSEGIAEKLGAKIKASGVTSAVVTGSSGSHDGTNSEAGRYYTLIRDQMYDAWERPLNLLGRGLSTQIRISVEKDGAISNVQLKRSSGNSVHDETALAAVRRVSKISEPLPEGLDGNIDINFKLTD